MKLKRILLASALALSFTVSAPTAAKADPVSAAIVTFAGFSAGTAAFAVAQFVVNTALYTAGSWALGKASKALGIGKQATQERQAAVTTLSLGETPREMIIGTACTGGSLIDAFNFGGKYGTDTATRCIAICDHEIDGIIGYFVDDQYYAWTGDGVQPGFNSKLSIEFKNARADGWDAPLHVRQNGGWTLQDRLCGVTHVWVDTRFDDQVWTQGHPKLKFVVRGLKAYDPRKDAANGYTGPNPHVWENPATHQFTQNAAILRYNFQRGVYATGRHGQPEHLLFGRGLSAVEAPPALTIAAANVCDEMVDGFPRYMANGVISAAQSFVEVESLFEAAMAGTVVQREGGLEIEPGQAKAVVKTITDKDLVGGEAASFSEFLPDNDGGRINTVIPRYVEPSQGWKDHGGPVRRDLDDIAEDGGPREMTLPLVLVTNAKQADRCAEIARRMARLERRATIVLPPGFAELEEGDWIAWQSARHHAGATVRYRVESWKVDEKWRQHLALREVASSVFGQPDPVEDETDPPPAPTPVDALDLTNVTCEAISLAGDTAAIPALRFRWDAPVDDGIQRIRAEVRVQGETEAAIVLTDDVNAGELIVTNGVVPDRVMEARLTPIGDTTRPVVPTVWFARATTTLKATDVEYVGGVPASQVLTDLEDVILDTQGLGIEVTDIEQRTTLIEARPGTNDLLDSEFDGYVAGDPSWWFASNHGSASSGVNFEVYWSANQNVLYSFLNDNPPAIALGDWRSGWMTAEEGARYEGAAMLAVHNGVGQVWMEFAAADQTVFPPTLLGTGGRPGGGQGGDPENFDMVGGFATAPAGAAFRRLLVRNLSMGGVGYTFMPFIRPYSRAATPTQTALSGYTEGASTKLRASVNEHEGALVALTGKTQAWSQKRVIAGSAQTFVQMLAIDDAGQITSDIRLGARNIGFWNAVDGDTDPLTEDQWVKAMDLAAGAATFYGALGAHSYVLLANGTPWYHAYRSQKFVVADDQAISYANFGVLPEYEFLRDNLLALNTSIGEAYDLRLINMTATGATVWAKINVPGTSGSQSNGPTTTVQGSGPRLQLGVTAASKPVSASGVYSVSGQVSGMVRVFGGAEDQQITGSGTVLVWVRKAGAWTQAGTANWSFSGQFSNPNDTPVSVPVSASYAGDIQLGEGVESIGVTFGGGSLSGANVSSLSTAWTSQGTPGGTRSALAAGATTTLRIIPQG